MNVVPELERDGSACEPHGGFEQGPIRPPSEARSLLVRVTRGCEWNRCTFCPVYKGSEFSARPAAHVKRDIDAVHGFVAELRELSDERGIPDRAGVERLWTATLQGEARGSGGDPAALAAAYHWVAGGGMRSVFLQDADALAAPPAVLREILLHLRARFPDIERVTTYARSGTLARIAPAQLASLREAGLDRIHVGLESGLNRVLKRVAKGASKSMHVAVGRAVREAGIELSVYVMPGLGGAALSRRHALESAEVLNRIDPDFIRLRTLAIAPGTPLHEEWRAGRFDKCGDLAIARELLVFIEALEGIGSVVKSDHVLNLFEDLEGRLPQDGERLAGVLRAFLELPDERRTRYQLGRRLGLLRHVGDLDSPTRMARVDEAHERLGANTDNIDSITDEIVARYI